MPCYARSGKEVPDHTSPRPLRREFSRPEDQANAGGHDLAAARVRAWAPLHDGGEAQC